jgi:hypothetical protein
MLPVQGGSQLLQLGRRLRIQASLVTDTVANTSMVRGLWEVHGGSFVPRGAQKIPPRCLD